MRFLILLASISAFAVETVPEYMKGAIITVKTKDGKEYKFKGEEYAVVKRGSKPELKPNNSVEIPENNLAKRTKHRVRLYGGRGPVDLKNHRNENSVIVEQDVGLILGVGYTYMFTDMFGVGASILNNNSQLLNLELDF